MIRRSKLLDHVTDDRFRATVAAVTSFSALMRALTLNPGSFTIRVLKNRIEDLGISTDHFRYDGYKSRKPTLESYFRRVTPFVAPWRVGRHLIEEGVLEHRCYRCNQGDEWNGKPLSMILNHVNGNTSDNRRENLEMVCPNCLAQIMNAKRAANGKFGWDVKLGKQREREYHKLVEEERYK